MESVMPHVLYRGSDISENSEFLRKISRYSLKIITKYESNSESNPKNMQRYMKFSWFFVECEYSQSCVNIF